MSKLVFLRLYFTVNKLYFIKLDFVNYRKKRKKNLGNQKPHDFRKFLKFFMLNY